MTIDKINKLIASCWLLIRVYGCSFIFFFYNSISQNSDNIYIQTHA